MNIKKEEITIAEAKLKDAMIASDLQMLDELLSPDLIFSNHLGLVLSKADDLAAHKSGDFIINDLQVSDQKTQLLDTVAIVTAHTKISGSYKGSPANGDFRFTRVWTQTHNRWQVIAGHCCLVALLPCCLVALLPCCLKDKPKQERHEHLHASS